MSKKSSRPPASFSVDEPESEHNTKPSRRAAASIELNDDHIQLTPDEEDVFSFETPPLDEENIAQIETASQCKRFSFTKLFISGFTVLIGLAIGLWVDNLITNLFAQSEWLGWIGVGLTSFMALGLIGLIWQEASAFMKLNSVGDMREQTSKINASTSVGTTWKLVTRITNAVSNNPMTSQGRQAVKELEREVVDSVNLIEFTERELLKNLDQQATQLISASAKRVSIVTAISPRALIDTGYVLFEMVRLARRISQIYGVRPGFLGTLKLLKSIAMHLAVTGAVSLGDSVVQQMIGQGVAAKISARFGEGFVNGLMTTRFGIVAMEVARPMPFRGLKRPSLSNFLNELNILKSEKK